MEKYRKKIPITSWNQYISGWESLNVATASKDPVDWHIRGYWYSDNPDISLKTYSYNPYLQNEGIRNEEVAFPLFEKAYIACNERAFVDLVYVILFEVSASERERTMLLATLRGDIYNFFPSDTERQYVFSMLHRIWLKTENDKIRKFLREEMPKEYYINIYGKD